MYVLSIILLTIKIITMKSDLKIKLRKLRTFLLFIVVQYFVVYAGVYLWFTLGDSVYKFVDLWQFSDLLYIPDLLTVLGQGLLILVTVFFGVLGSAVLLCCFWKLVL